MNKTADKQPRLNRWLALPPEKLLQILQGSCRLCLSELMPSCRVTLFVKDINGISLLQMAHELSGTKLENQSDLGRPMDVCLSCAGNLVHFYQFRMAYQENEKEVETIVTAIRMKLRSNLGNNVDEDDDVQVIYVCRHCKKQFENDAEYKEHKKTHANPATQVASSHSKTSIAENNVNLNGNAQKPKNHQEFVLKAEALKAVKENVNPSTSSLKCVECKIEFENEDDYHYHYESTPHDTAQKTVAALKIRQAGGLRAQNGEKIKENKPVSKQTDVKVDPTDVQNSGEFKCDHCPSSFASNRGRTLHFKHRHSKNPMRKRNRDSPYTRREILIHTCPSCGENFDTYKLMYSHTKKCTNGQLATNLTSMFDNGEAAQDMNETRKTTCSCCSEVFSSARSKSLHEKTVHNLDIRECRVCHQMFDHYLARYLHEKRCVLEKGLSLKFQL